MSLKNSGCMESAFLKEQEMQKLCLISGVMEKIEKAGKKRDEVS